jgi:hypothetical protein
VSKNVISDDTYKSSLGLMLVDFSD